MQTLFLYIDDDKVIDSAEKVQGFEQAGLKVMTNQHKGTWESQLKFVKEQEPILDGLILDLRLDDFPNEEGERADFRGTSLAQEIRTRQKEGEFKSYPIVLFSGNEKLERSLESSGRDLFDLCIDKGRVDGRTFDILSPRLSSLACGYKILSNTKKTSDILSIDVNVVDERFISQLEELYSEPVHVIARFLSNELIGKQGLLLNERILAARLGIDIVHSADWTKVLESLSHAKYKGIFSDGWHRWWMAKVDEWWHSVLKTGAYLRSTSAKERVEIIKSNLKLSHLWSAEKIAKADSDEYWTICKGYGTPLDPTDGLMIDGQENLYPWQDAEYVSVDAALRRKNNDVWKKVAKLEEERLSDLEQQFKKRRI